MKKTSKKVLALALSVSAMMSAFAFVGCGDSEAEGKKVMNLSLNPEVEFVLDANDQVVSVNALNEEGNLIISSATFTGKSADEAVELFVKVSDETGFLFEGELQAGENERRAVLCAA